MLSTLFVCVALLVIISNTYSSEVSTVEFSSYTMDPVNLEHSIKDIPVPKPKVYKQMMINSLEKFIQNLRWKVIFFLNPCNSQKKETFGFKSTRVPDAVPELKPFEDDLIEMVKNIEFRNVNNTFQNKLKEEQEFVRNQSKVFVAADKTTNFYLIEPNEYKKHVDKNVQKEYKKAKDKNIRQINQAHKTVVRKLELQDRVFKTMDRQCFITAKDHKNDFQNSPSFRLLNPTKGEIGKISKQILTRILKTIRGKTELQQMKNVYTVIDWFKSLENKQSLAFIIFDVVNYYPSITQELFEKAIVWAKGFEDISDDEKDILIQSKKSVLFSNGDYWTKKSESDFDNAMGAYDGAECCDLVGLFMLSEIRKLNLNLNCILYRDDGLGVSSSTPRQREGIKKKICEVFNKHGLSVTGDANKKIVQFLDVELNLSDGSYKPYIKPNDKPLYVNMNSNHPSSIKKNIPEAINKRLSALSSSEEMFKSVAPLYQEALKNAGYNYELKFKPVDTSQNQRKSHKHKRNILYFNPPYSQGVKTNVGAKFLKLIGKHFPKNNPLSKIINRNTVKMSYRCTPNMSQIISSHNSKILKNEELSEERKCNCSKNNVCPLGGKCLEKKCDISGKSDNNN